MKPTRLKTKFSNNIESLINLASRPQIPRITPGQPRPADERYQINCDSLAESGVSHEIYVFLKQLLARDGGAFRLEDACSPCTAWDNGERQRKPSPPGAHDPTQGCSGCYYAYLEPVQAAEEAMGDRQLLYEKLKTLLDHVAELQGQHNHNPRLVWRAAERVVEASRDLDAYDADEHQFTGEAPAIAKRAYGPVRRPQPRLWPTLDLVKDRPEPHPNSQTEVNLVNQ